MEPWGTPYLIFLTDDNWPLTLQHCLWFLRYDLKKSNSPPHYTVVPKFFQQNAVVNGVKCFFDVEKDS